MRWRFPRTALLAHRRPVVLASMLAVAVLAPLMLEASWPQWPIHWPGKTARQNASLQARLEKLQAAPPSAQQDCATWRAERPLVLLVLGQSNAGNHGEPSPAGSAAVRVMNAGMCSSSADPLPGGTGRGGSVWSLLPAALAAGGLARPVVLQLLAVDATTVDDWTRRSSTLRQRLQNTLGANAVTGMAPDMVLWQQGEADAIAGTPPAHYADGLQLLSQQLFASGVQAPLLLALSTVCRSIPDAELRESIARLANASSSFAAGPDTDLLAPQRYDGCHFSQAGRQQAASLWAKTIQAHLAAKALLTKP